MASLKNKRKLAAVTRETREKHPRNGQSRNTPVPRINEEYITQVSEEIEGRVTKKLSQEFSRTESRILGALSKLDDFLLNQQIRTHSGTVPETFRNINVDNQGTNEDDPQSDPHPEAGLFRSQTRQNSGPEVGPYNVRNISALIRLLFQVVVEVNRYEAAHKQSVLNSVFYGPMETLPPVTGLAFYLMLLQSEFLHYFQKAPQKLTEKKGKILRLNKM